MILYYKAEPSQVAHILKQGMKGRIKLTVRKVGATLAIKLDPVSTNKCDCYAGCLHFIYHGHIPPEWISRV